MDAVAYLVLENPSARNNLGTLIRCAAAFAVEEVVVVGASKWSTHGAHGSHKHVKYRCFHDWAAAASFLRTERGCDLCGIVRQSTPTRAQNVPTESRTMPVLEQQDTGTFDADGCPVPCDGTVSDGDDEASNVGENPAERPQETSEETSAEKPEELSEENMGVDRRSIAVRHRPFRRSTAFLVGHHGRLGHEALGLCDFLVHVEQTSESPMELGPPVTVSIALHHFTAWARYEERRFTGEKFDVDRELARCRPPADENNDTAEERARLREERRTADPLEAQDATAMNGKQDAGGGAGLRWFAEDDDQDQLLEGDY